MAAIQDCAKIRDGRISLDALSFVRGEIGGEDFKRLVEGHWQDYRNCMFKSSTSAIVTNGRYVRAKNGAMIFITQ